MATTHQEIIDSLAAGMVEIADGRIYRWQEGDKRGEFHRLDHMAKALETAKKIRDDESDATETLVVSTIC